MIRFVPDSNVLVSAPIARDGPPGQILVAWLQGKVELAASTIRSTSVSCSASGS